MKKPAVSAFSFYQVAQYFYHLTQDFYHYPTKYIQAFFKLTICKSLIITDIYEFNLKPNFYYGLNKPRNTHNDRLGCSHISLPHIL
jgi:hypothetical protein